MCRKPRQLVQKLFLIACFAQGLGLIVPTQAIDDKKAALVTPIDTTAGAIPVDGVLQSEEDRNKKTFQVAKIVIKANPEAVFKVFTDYEHAPAVFSYLKGCRVVSTTPPNKQVWFEATTAGGLLKFEYVLEFKECAPQLIEWHRVSGAFKANEGYWKFDPVENGKSTLVTYSKYVEAGFPFPQFLVKKELKDNMPKILAELKKSVENPG